MTTTVTPETLRFMAPSSDPRGASAIMQRVDASVNAADASETPNVTAELGARISANELFADVVQRP